MKMSIYLVNGEVLTVYGDSSSTPIGFAACNEDGFYVVVPWHQVVKIVIPHKTDEEADQAMNEAFELIGYKNGN